MIVWLNLNSKQEVDELFERWEDTGAEIVETVEDKPWNLREFRVADPDGNVSKVHRFGQVGFLTLEQRAGTGFRITASDVAVYFHPGMLKSSGVRRTP